jgi:hypothetical protein
MNRRLTISLAGITLAGITGPVAAQDEAQTYDIQLHRPAAVGQILRVRGDGMQQRTLTAIVDETPNTVEEQTVSITFNAQAEILAVDELGRPTHVKYVVMTCEMLADDETLVIVPRDGRFTAQRDESTTRFELDGEPITGVRADALMMVAGLEADVVVEDEILGSVEPRVLGQNWSINVDNAIRQLAATTGQTAGESDVTGSTWLVRTQDHEDQPCLLVRSQMTTENIVPGIAQVPEGYEVNGAMMTVDIERDLPIDVSVPVLRRAVTLNFDATVTGPMGADGQPTEMRLNGSRRVNMNTSVITTPGTVVTAEDVSTPEG